MQVLYFGAREHLFIYLFIYLFIMFYTFVKLCGCQCIWDLKCEEYWEECDELSDLSPSRCLPWHCLFQAMAWINTLIQSHIMFYCSRMSLSMQPMQVHKLINSPMKETWPNKEVKVWPKELFIDFYFNVILPFLT